MLLSDVDLASALDRAREWVGGDHKTAFPSYALLIDPYTEGSVQPASIDLRLGGQHRYWPLPEPGVQQVIDPLHPEDGPEARIWDAGVPGSTFIVCAGEFVLAHTAETVMIGRGLAAQVYGKSSIGRCGLEVENAGYIDPGFTGQITLELKNTTDYDIRLTIGMPIAQMAVSQLSTPALRPYGHPERDSRYQGQAGATASRYALGRTRTEV